MFQKIFFQLLAFFFIHTFILSQKQRQPQRFRPKNTTEKNLPGRRTLTSPPQEKRLQHGENHRLQPFSVEGSIVWPAVCRRAGASVGQKGEPVLKERSLGIFYAGGAWFMTDLKIKERGSAESSPPKGASKRTHCGRPKFRCRRIRCRAAWCWWPRAWPPGSRRYPISSDP